jgi:hypothetical protein
VAGRFVRDWGTAAGPGWGDGDLSPWGSMGPEGARVPGESKSQFCKRLTRSRVAQGGSRRDGARHPDPTDALLTVDAVGSKWVLRLLSSRSKPGVQSGVGISPSAPALLPLLFRRKLAALVSDRAIAAGMIICLTVRK